MRRFIIYHPQKTAEIEETGIIAYGCEMWPQGPVALVWTIEPYNQSWLLSMDGLNGYGKPRLQDGMQARGTEILFFDNPHDSMVEAIKFRFGSSNSFPIEEVQEAFRGMTGIIPMSQASSGDVPSFNTVQ